MKNVPAAVLCLLAARVVGALPGGIAPPTGAVESFEYSLTNDSGGFGPVQEWDDLRTFGIGLGVGLSPRLGLSADYQSLTWRSDNPGTASRIDALGVSLTAVLLEATTGRLALTSRASVGASIFGDLGGMVLQAGYHDRVGLERPIPEAYDPYSAATLSLSLLAEASLAAGPVRPAILASVDGDIPGSWRFQAGASAAAGRGGSGARAWVLYRHETVAGLSPTLDAVSRLARGVEAGFEVEAGWLACSSQLTLPGGVSRSAVGLRVGGTARDGEATPLPIAIEFHLDPAGANSGSRVLVPLGSPGSPLRACVGAFMGWQEMPAGATVGLRSAEYSAGLEARLRLPAGRLEGELACSLEPVMRVLSEHPMCLERSCVQDSCVLLSARLSPALRIGYADRRVPARKAGLGVSLGLEAPALTVLSFRSRPAAPWMPFSLRLFLFGESM
jgi:hypothetical protein